MKTPNIRFYARMLNTTQKATPKFTIVGAVGYYPPMELLRGRDNKISMNLMEKSKEGINVPSMRLQAKGSLNFTGLKEWFVNDKLSGFAYGYPSNKPTYSKDNKPNPFYDYRNDGYLFVVHQDQSNPKNLIPTEIELIVLEDARVLISSYCKLLVIGGFNEALENLRKQAKPL